MTIILNHTIVPASDKLAAARFFASIFRLNFNEQESDHFHYAFHVSDAEFEAIFERIKKAGLSYGSAPWNLDDGELNDWNGGRGVYFKDPNGHVLELMTVPQ
jgi:catechol 2,3-dioxygenase-like lactoylglutathione lyase family enzyme